MKKRLLLSSLIAAAGAVPALANAQSSTLTISGIMDAGVRLDNGATSGNIKSLGSGLMSGSRLNFTGIEDLGDGLKAAFVLESGLAIDTGLGAANPPGAPAGALTFGRTSALALGSDAYGYLSLGRQYTPLWAISAGPMLDPFGGQWMGGARTVFNTTVSASNAIVYSYGYTARAMLLPAPRNGLGVSVMYAPGEAASPAPSDSGRQAGFNASYGNGTWWVGYGYHRINGSSAAISPTAPVTNLPRLTQQTLGASYDFGFARLHAGLNTGENKLTTADALNRRNWHLGATVPFSGNQTVRVTYGKAHDRARSNADFSSWQVGYQYDLSKRTNLYAGIGVVDNDANAAATLAGAVAVYSKGNTARSYIAGIRHLF